MRPHYQIDALSHCTAVCIVQFIIIWERIYSHDEFITFGIYHKGHIIIVSVATYLNNQMLMFAFLPLPRFLLRKAA